MCRLQHIIVALLCLSLLPDTAFSESVYTVSNQIKIENPTRFGINYETSPFAPWSDTSWNCWNAMYSFEPITFRHILQATGGDTGFIECIKGKPTSAHPLGNSKSVGPGYYGIYPNDFWNGAEVNIYRYNGESLALLRTAHIKKFYGNSDSEQRIYLTTHGVKIEKGDVCDLVMNRLSPPMDSLKQHPNVIKSPEYALHRRKYFGAWFYPVTESLFQRSTRIPELQSVLDDTTCAPTGNSTASLKISFPGSDTEAVGLGQQYINQAVANRFPEGKSFRVEVWIKNNNLDGTVLLQAGGYASQEFEITNTWEKYSLEFTPKGAVPNGKAFMVGSQAKGTIWIDNLICYQTDLKPFQIYPETMNGLKTLNPGCLRSLSGRQALTLDSFLSEGFSRKQIFDMKTGPSNGSRYGNFSLNQQLTLCKNIGANPWIMSYICWTDEEIQHFMEYLGAPADIGYGKVRAAHGRTEPWTQEFDHIYIECANEIWNPNYNPQAFPNDPELCGQLSERLLSQLKKSTWNTENNILGISPARTVGGLHMKHWNPKLKSWSYRAAEQFPSLDALGASPSGYIGGWDNASIESNNLTDALANNLFFGVRMFEPLLPEFNSLRKALGNNFMMCQYESGPGYPLPSPKQPFDEKVEQVNKSLAMGVATLDNLMYVISNNGLINYFNYKKGPNWSTHNENGIPHTTYLALLLRNRHAQGALMHIEEGKQDTVNLPEVKIGRFGAQTAEQARTTNMTKPAIKDVPLTRVYAFKDDKRNSFLMLNRSYSKPQTVTIHIPYTPHSVFTEYLLTHKNPATTNRDGYNIQIQETEKKGFTKTFTYTIPPTSAVTLVNYEQ